MVIIAIMRYILPHVLKDLQRKMVFIGGPRQVGKTTLARYILEKHFKSGRYFNWDFDEDRTAILKKRWREDDKLLVFDEIHKFPKWKQWFKGIYDVLGDKHRILITGSARLDVYRRGGDSLLGRYHYWRLHPFTLDELPISIDKGHALEKLMTIGGFPEPLLTGNETETRRWRRERFDRVIREDIRDLEGVRDIQMLRLLLDLLRERVGSPIVISNIARDLQVAHKTVKMWIQVLERMYLIFVVRPYVKSSPRSILKPPKIYFFDNGDVKGDEGACFENLVASSLLKRLHFLEDSEGYEFDLYYIRDKEGREVDFAIVKDGVLQEIIEAKYSDENISRGLKYYSQKLRPTKATQIVATLKNSFDEKGVRVMSPFEYFGHPLWNAN
ncbi:MAG: hypothetical protein DRG71_08205 [Deltaproteobacteria bacterium]|nr:MAG: hypothetical protein DRG71_08205 [Deltaproteobacteria bacterium]